MDWHGAARRGGGTDEERWSDAVPADEHPRRQQIDPEAALDPVGELPDVVLELDGGHHGQRRPVLAGNGVDLLDGIVGRQPGRG